VPVTLQILARYIDFVPRYIWTEEVARFCFIWIIMIGSMIAVRDGSHFDVDLLPRPRSNRGRGVALLVVHTAMLLMALVFSWYGYGFAQFGYIQNSELAGINMLSIYISFPLAGVTWLVFLLEKFVEDVRIMREPQS
jgi:TRAP-type C4-dicarboxylate transport system permease small subunit